MKNEIIKITRVKDATSISLPAENIKEEKNVFENISDACDDATPTEINNDRFLRLMSYYLNDFDRVVKIEDVNDVASAGVDISSAFCYVLSAYLGIDAYKKDRKFFNDYFLQSIKMLDVNDYYKDEYYKNVTFDDENIGDVTLTYKTYAPCQGFVRDDFEFYDDGKVLPRIGFFSTEYRYPAILQKGVEWMTLLPNEINSQKKYVEKAHGKVLTYGLGLGYYAFHTAIKQNVESVTVVDLSENVIEVFCDRILPKFPEYAKKKIKIVHADAFKFAENLKEGDFDYIYADIWHDCGDGRDLYLKFKDLEKFCPTAEFGYWIEDSIKYYL